MTPSQRPMPLASSVYHQPLRRGIQRGSTAIAVAASDSLRAGRALRRLLPAFRRADHVAAMYYHVARAKWLDQVWSSVAERAAFDAFGRPWQFYDYRICAIGREEFAAHHKRVLRHCAYNSTKHRDLARAHARAAGLRKVRDR